jgi:hypothetical protein
VWCSDFLTPENGDPFLAALLPIAMMTSQPLTIDAPVSAKLWRALPEIQSVYGCFDKGHSRVKVTAPLRTQRAHPGKTPAKIGLFFSMGVDSFYSLLKNVRDHPADEDTITHLIPVHGFDVYHPGWDSQFTPTILEHTQMVAEGLNKTLLPVVTNLRYVMESLEAAWSMYHGAALASVALAMGSLFRRVHIAASTTYDQLYPLGTHPVLDPLWSTESLSFVHDGCELDRIDKTRMAAQSPLALETLRVCPGHVPEYNCGRCIKCLPTMIDLLQVGALQRCRTFPDEIDIEQLRQMLLGSLGKVNYENYQRRFAACGSSAEFARLKDVLAEYLAAEANAPTGSVPPHPRHEAARRWRLLPGLLRR